MARTQPLIATNALIGTWTGLRLALAGTLLAVVVLVAVLAAVSLGSGPAVAPATHAGPVNASMFRALESGAVAAPATHAGPVNASMFRALESGER